MCKWVLGLWEDSRGVQRGLRKLLLLADQQVLVLVKGSFRRGMCREEKQYPYGSSWHLEGSSSGAVILLALWEGQWQ